MKYQLILKFRAASQENFDWLIEVEDAIAEFLGNDHIVDGHDFGAGEMNLFIHTNDPKIALEKARDVLAPRTQHEFIAAYRELDGDEYIVLWPEGYTGEFNVV